MRAQHRDPRARPLPHQHTRLLFESVGPRRALQRLLILDRKLAEPRLRLCCPPLCLARSPVGEVGGLHSPLVLGAPLLGHAQLSLEHRQPLECRAVARVAEPRRCRHLLPRLPLKLRGICRSFIACRTQLLDEVASVAADLLELGHALSVESLERLVQRDELGAMLAPHLSRGGGRRSPLLLERVAARLLHSRLPRSAVVLKLAPKLVKLSPRAFGVLQRALRLPLRALQLLLLGRDRDARPVELLLRQPPPTVLQPQVKAERRDLLRQLPRHPLGCAQPRVLGDEPEHVVLPAQPKHARLQPEPIMGAHCERGAAIGAPLQLCVGGLGGRRGGRGGGDALGAGGTLLDRCIAGCIGGPQVLVSGGSKEAAAQPPQHCAAVSSLLLTARCAHVVEELFRCRFRRRPSRIAAI